MDRISNLPDEWKVQILTFLPQDEAFRTSVLSKSWSHVWGLLPDLFLVMDRNTRSPQRFRTFVNQVLARREESQISLNCFHLSSGTDLREQIFQWFANCITLGVKHIHLTLQNNLLFQSFDWGVFHNAETLVELVLEGGILLAVPGGNLLNFPNIRKIKLLSLFYTNDNAVPNLVSACPELEELIVKRDRAERNHSVRVFTIQSNSLRILEIQFLLHGGQNKLRVRAPNLERVRIHDMHSKSVYLVSCDLAAEAYIESAQYCPVHVMRCFRFISSLTLGQRALQRLNTMINRPNNLEMANRGLPVFNQLRKFALEQCHWELLNHLLLCMPELQELTFSKGLGCASNSEHPVWDPQWPVPVCVSTTLRMVETSSGISDRELPLLGFILLHSIRLAKVSITRGNQPLALDENIIVALPRASAECEFEFV